MNYLTNLKKYTAVGLLALSLFVTACGADPGVKLNNEGNDVYAQEAYLEALNLYQNAQIENPELAEPYYNAANAFYREGQFDQALAQMQQALLYADAGLAQQSYFNLGNNFFNAQDLETAVQSYIEALLLNPDDADAKYNLELALNQQQQQQQQQEQQDQQDQQQENQEQNQDQQQEGSEGEQEQENQDQQDQSEDGQNGEQDQEQEGDQSEEGQDGEQENQDQNGEQEQDGQEGDEGEEQQDQQGQNGDPQDQQDEGQAGQQPQPNQPGQENGEQGSAGLQPGEKLSEEQAEQLLAAIAGNSQTLQEKLGQIMVVPGPPPAQDW